MDELDENDKVLAAAAHLISIAVFGGWGPLLMFFVFSNKPFIRYHSGQAAVFQLVFTVLVIGIALCTFGLGALLILPWWVLEAWLAYEAFQGRWTGYPGMASLFLPVDVD